MGASESKYTIGFDDKASKPASEAASRLEQLKNHMTALDAAMKLARNSGKAMTSTYGQQVLAAQQLRGKITGLESVVARERKQTEDARKTSEKWKQSLSSMHGPLGSLARAFFQFQEGGPARTTLLLGGAQAAILGIAAAIVTAVAAITAVVVAGTIALVRYGLAQAEARRSELLHLEGLTTLRTAYQRQRESGTELQASIDRVADSSALARPELAGMAESLYRAGLRGSALTETLEGLSIAQSVQGDRGAARFRAMAISAARTGGSVHALTESIRSRLGPIASRQALSWDRQMSRLHESFGHLFDDIHVDGLLQIMHEVINTFSQSTASGRSLRALINVLFSGLGTDATNATQAIHHGFALIINGALRVTIAVLRVRNALRDAFASGGAFAGGEAFGNAISNAILKTNWISVGGRIVLAIMSGLGSLGQIRVAISVAFTGFVAGLIRSAVTQYSGVGGAIVDGIARGITAGLGRLRSAMTSLGASLPSTLRDVLGIHSPSRVFAQLGVQIPRGVAVGVDAGAGDASDAVASMSGGLADDAPIGGAVTSSSSSTSIGPFYITANGSGAREQAEDLRTQLTSIFAGMNLRRGARGAAGA